MYSKSFQNINILNSKDHDYVNQFYGIPNFYSTNAQSPDQLDENDDSNEADLNETNYYANTSYTPSLYTQLNYTPIYYNPNDDLIKSHLAADNEYRNNKIFSKLPIVKNNEPKKKVKFRIPLKTDRSIEVREPWHKFYYKIPPQKPLKEAKSFGFDNQADLNLNKAQKKVIVTDNVVYSSRQPINYIMSYNTYGNLSRIDVD
jgi:hypothetical protein